MIGAEAVTCRLRQMQIRLHDYYERNSQVALMQEL